MSSDNSYKGPRPFERDTDDEELEDEHLNIGEVEQEEDASSPMSEESIEDNDRIESKEEEDPSSSSSSTAS